MPELKPAAVRVSEPVRPAKLSRFIRALVLDPTESPLVQFVRYAAVGTTALAADMSILFLLTQFAGVYYLTSAAISFLAGLGVNYALSRVWVFNRRTLSNSWIEFLIFAAIGVIGLGFNELGIWLLTAKAGMYYLAAKGVTAIFVYLWNFGARKYALFR